MASTMDSRYAPKDKHVPPSGDSYGKSGWKGHVVIALAGRNGIDQGVRDRAQSIADLGYTVGLFESWPMRNDSNALKQAILEAQQMPISKAGKVALLGFSLGGYVTLKFGTRMPDLVCRAVACYPYPLTADRHGFFIDPTQFHPKIRVLVMPGETDHYGQYVGIGDPPYEPPDKKLADLQQLIDSSSGMCVRCKIPDDHGFPHGGWDTALRETGKWLAAAWAPQPVRHSAPR